MRNPRESFPLFIPEYFPITHNPSKNYGFTQNIGSNACILDN